MTELETWEATNSAYLGAALEWLRLRLSWLAHQANPVVPSSPLPVVRQTPEAEEGRSRWNLFRRATDEKPEPATVRLQLPAPAVDTLEQSALDDAASKLATAAACDPSPALMTLSERFGLSTFEREILLLGVAMELDTRVAALCASAQNDSGRAYPTFALAFALFDAPTWEALSPERPLRYFRLLEINQPGAQPLTTSALRVDERIVNYAKGLNYLDERLANFVSLMEGVATSAVPPSQMTAVDTIVRAATAPSGDVGVRRAIRLVGPDAVSKRSVASAACAALGVRACRLSAEMLPPHAGELESLARLWQRETVLLPLALYIDFQGGAPGAGSEGPVQHARRFALRAGGLVLLDIGDGQATEAVTTVEVRRPTPLEQRTAWEAALGPGAGDAPAHLAGQFVLTLADIREVASSAQDTVARGGGDLLAVLWRECLLRTRPALDSLAENLAPKARWKDIVLPETETRLLHQIAAQVSARAKVYDAWGFRERMNRGLGITALFAGESGTGKTMAAEVLANALELNLYRVDLSAVVSKYIGETEKNLRQVFDAAEHGGAILFFDEADALFGKRSEVKDSHDRYANIEINYLLQRMEAYRGLAILATNMKSALDPAFMRRLRFIVNFQYPAVAERREIWSRVFPDDTPKRGLDFDRLARLNLTGGNIHSVALNAAFLAAQAGEPVTMRLVLDAARTELRKLDRPINEADFRWVEPAGAAA